MLRLSNMGSWLRCATCVGALSLPVVLVADERTPRKARPQAEAVEIFAGIDNGQLEVQLIAASSAKCTLLVTNTTDKPLSVQLPPALAGVPVLAQQLGPFNDQFDFDRNNRQDRNTPQPIGIGPGPMMNNFRNPMMNIMPNRGWNMNPGVQFNIPPEKVGKLKLPAVCLEHGLPNPRPKIKYELRPIESVTEKAGIAELCALLGRKEIPQRVAQLAAWHINNDMSWEKLAGLRKRASLGTQPMYPRREIQAGKKAAEKAIELAKESRPSDPGKATSLSQR